MRKQAWSMKIFSISCASPIISPSVHSSHPHSRPPLPTLNRAGWVGRTLSGGHCLWTLPRLGNLLAEAWGPDLMCGCGLAPAPALGPDHTKLLHFPSQECQVIPSLLQATPLLEIRPS